MSWTPTDEQVETAVRAAWEAEMGQAWDDERSEVSPALRGWIRDALVAVGPMIAAQGIREYVTAARENRSAYQWEPSEVFDDAEQWADQIEKEAGR